MQKSVMSQVQAGRLYAKQWPMRKELSPLFIEFKIIKATDLAITVMPILAMLTLFFQINYLGPDFLPQAIASALFFISLPLQGLLWLGKRAQTPLEPAMQRWYNDLYTKMLANGYQTQLNEKKPRYLELANLLKDMFDKMDKAFTKEQF
ncbi:MULTISPECIES: terminus macrodomain insulation protein YfbV [unclassified Pseudoalteromonas]|uniref:terminus macrodomain insulation protein YfbV n=1 Tax=unclassified Pseudoalteromonas TaxID=194690 RepID=UPI0038677370